MMDVGKRIMGVFALLLMLVSGVVPITNLNAEEVNYTTQDFYAVDNEGIKINELDIKETEEFGIQFARENAKYTQTQAILSEKIILNEEETDGINELDNVQIA